MPDGPMVSLNLIKPPRVFLLERSLGDDPNSYIGGEEELLSRKGVLWR